MPGQYRNSTAVAQAHYLKVTDSDFERAAKSGAVVVQKAVQSVFATSEHGLSDSTYTMTGDDHTASMSAIGKTTYYPQGDSNPCLSRERAMS